MASLLFVVMDGVVWWLLPAWLQRPSNTALLVAWWVVASGLAGVLLHGAFVLIVHDAAHGNVWGKRWDRWVGAIASGALLLPFVAGDYAATHLRHHRLANRPGDNNWTRLRSWLYQRSRLAYMLYEILPVVNNLDRLTGNTVPRDYPAMVLAWLVAIAVWIVADISPWWYVSCLGGLSIVNAARLWVEHMGHDQAPAPIAHTYGGCVFGFGIGNHSVHHQFPRVPALILTVGLWMRRHDAHVFTGWWHVACDRTWNHFSQMDSGRSNRASRHNVADPEMVSA
jgi:hypothetical protein